MLVVTSTLSSPAPSHPNICHRYYPKAKEHKDLSHFEKVDVDPAALTVRSKPLGEERMPMHQIRRVQLTAQPGLSAITAAEHVKQEQGQMAPLYTHIDALPAQAHPRVHLITVQGWQLKECLSTKTRASICLGFQKGNQVHEGQTLEGRGQTDKQTV